MTVHDRAELVYLLWSLPVLFTVIAALISL